MYMKVLLVLSLVGTPFAQYGLYENDEEENYYENQEVKNRQNNAEEQEDYYDKPKYRFGAKDHFHSEAHQPDNRDGNPIKAYYSVHEPERVIENEFDDIEDRKGPTSSQHVKPTTDDFFKHQSSHHHSSSLFRGTAGSSPKNSPEETGSHHVHNSHHGAALSFASYNNYKS